MADQTGSLTHIAGGYKYLVQQVIFCGSQDSANLQRVLSANCLMLTPFCDSSAWVFGQLKLHIPKPAGCNKSLFLSSPFFFFSQLRHILPSKPVLMKIKYAPGTSQLWYKGSTSVGSLTSKPTLLLFRKYCPSIPKALTGVWFMLTYWKWSRLIIK